MPHASVVIPTFNGAARFPRVLAALADQTAPDGSFEILVVDNASTDNTAEVAEHGPATQRLRDRGCAFRVIAEPLPGTTFARIRGVREAQSRLICFLDDDNIPERDYVANGLTAFEDQTLALAVSRISARWEVAPPPSILKRQHLFAINDYLGDCAQDWGAEATLVPTVTAGLWVRRDAFLRAIPLDRIDLLMSGRIGSRLVGGEDIEIGLLFGKAGYRRGYTPSLRIAHEIPRERFETAYVIRLIEAIVRGELTLRKKYEGKKFGSGDRAMAALRLAAAVCAIPALLLGRDAQREVAFVMAARRAYLKGPVKAAS